MDNRQVADVLFERGTCETVIGFASFWITEKSWNRISPAAIRTRPPIVVRVIDPN